MPRSRTSAPKSDKVRARINEHLRHIRGIGGAANTPSAAMNENVHRCVRLFRGVEVELLDLRRTIGESARRAQAGKGRCALLSSAPGYFRLVGRPRRLVVAGIDLLLVIIEEYERPFRLWRHTWRHVRLRPGSIGNHRSPPVTCSLTLRHRRVGKQRQVPVQCHCDRPRSSQRRAGGRKRA